MVNWGKVRYRKQKQIYQQHGYHSDLPSFKKLGREVHGRVEGAIRDFFEENTLPQAPVPNWLPFIWDLEPDVVAYIGLKVLFDLIMEERGVADASFKIAKALEDEVRVRYFREHMPKSDWLLLERDRKDANSRYRFVARFWDKERKHHKNGRYKRFELWKSHHKLHIGTWLLETIRLNTGIFYIRRQIDRKSSKKFITPVAKLFDWVKQYDENCEVLSPFYLCTNCPPIKWSQNYGGGYDNYEELRPLPILKNQNIKDRDLSILYEPLNRLQEIPWRVNKEVLKVMQWAWEKDIKIGVMEKSELLEPLEEVEGLKEKDYEAFVEWKKKAKYIYQYNQRSHSKRIRCLKILHLYKKYSSEPKIYFPYQVDYRGRVYAVPTFVNPQSCDLGRSGLEFANGVPINNDEDSKWLRIHGANVFGIKGTFEDRLKWIDQRTKEIQMSGENPRIFDWWTEASDPWAFLAFCIEYNSFLKEGYGFITHLPCHMDASANGLQILSLLIKDETIAKQTNLVPGLPVQDLYTVIADDVNAKLHVQKNTQSLAGDWLKFGIDRSFTKKIVMCKPFGMNGYTSMDVVEDVFKTKVMQGRTNPFDNSEYVEALLYLSNIINKSTNKVIEPHIDYMKWMKAIAFKCKEPLRWTSPFGLQVVQSICDWKQLAIYSFMGFQQIKLTNRKDIDEMRPNAMAKAIVPNYIHSIDASVVHFLACKSDYDVGTIHDSFATQSPNAPKMHNQLREIYKDIFSIDLIAKFKDEVSQQLGTIPQDSFELGTLDVSAINDCEYLFH
jgi:DNA-directed RNA polymerase